MEFILIWFWLAKLGLLLLAIFLLYKALTGRDEILLTMSAIAGTLAYMSPTTIN